jgi:putative transposase
MVTNRAFGAGRRQPRRVKTLLHSIYDQPDAQAVHAQADRVLDTLAGKLPSVVDHLDQAHTDVLEFTGFPKEIWRQSGPTISKNG